MKRTLLLFLMAIFPLSSQAGYADHLGGSGTHPAKGKMLIVGDDIFAAKENYTALTDKYSITGLSVSANISKKFSGWELRNISRKGQKVGALEISYRGSDVVLFCAGLADLLSGTPPQKFKLSYDRQIKKALKTSAVYLCNLSPVQPWFKEHSRISGSFAAYQKVLRELAEENEITLVDLHRVNAENPKYFVDGITPVLYGSEFIADCLHQVITGEVAASLPAIFTDNMILQRDQPIPVFGRGAPGTGVTVTWDGSETLSGKVDSHGYWMVKLKAKEADSQARTLEVKVGNKNFSYKNVLIGDVWLACGQSNMASVPVSRCVTRKQEEQNFPKEGYRTIRVLQLNGKSAAGRKLYNWSDKFGRENMPYFNYYSISGNSWYEASSYKQISRMSGIAWFFIKQIHLDHKVPAGIIQSAIGGTSIESYIPHKAFFSEKEITAQVASGDSQRGGMLSWVNDPMGAAWAQEVAALQRSGLNRDDVPLAFHPMEHSFLYRSGVQPFIPFALKGAIWYQGESNANTGLGTGGPPTPVSRNMAQYRALVRGWRQAWDEASGESNKLPFLFVQLPVIGTRPAWPFYRDAQFRFWQDKSDDIDKVGMAVALEFGDGGSNVHPYSKSYVSKRLARVAQRYAYDNNNYFYSGPVARAVEAIDDKLYVSFEPVSTGEGLRARQKGKELRYFEIAASNGRYFPAKAAISGKRIVLSSAQVKMPVAVRYCWDDNPLGKKITEGMQYLLASSSRDTVLTASPFRLGEENFIIEKIAGPKSSKEFAVKGEMNSKQLPDKWRFLNKGKVENIFADGTLKIKTEALKNDSVIEIAEGSVWTENICRKNSSESFTLECRLKVKSGTAFIAPDNGGCFTVIKVLPESIVFNGRTYRCDNASEFVTVRLAYLNSTDTLTLFRNGRRLGEQAAVPGSSRARIFFGDGSRSIRTDSEFDYLRYTAGAYSPLADSTPAARVESAEVLETSEAQLLLKVLVSEGRALQLNALGFSVAEKSRSGFAAGFSDFRVYSSVTEDLSSAQAAGSVSADVSDVALYGGFSCEFSPVTLKRGENFIWLKARGTGKPLTCESLSLLLDGEAIKPYKISK